MSERVERLYDRAGIDVESFYRTLFSSDELLDPRWFQPLERFDIRYARTLWVYDNVAPGSSVLDVGCGSGMLALLGRKGVELTGVDISEEAVEGAVRNGYSRAHQGSLLDLSFPDGSFDHVVSLDVLGHVDAADKPRAIAEIRRVLRPGGTTLHGIECTDHEVKPRYDEMSDEQLRRFLSVDGHVGLEEEHEHAARFAAVFAHVDHRSRFGLTMSAEEFLKQSDQYGERYEPDWIAWLRTLDAEHRAVFDRAMGYVFARVSELDVREPRNGYYILLRASDRQLGPFAGEHRDRRALLAEPATSAVAQGRCLDRDPTSTWDVGWYPAEDLPPKARWMGAEGYVSFPSDHPRAVQLDLLTHLPDLRRSPALVEVTIGGAVATTLVIAEQGWRHVVADVPRDATPGDDGRWVIRFRCDRTYRPDSIDGGADDRVLSIAVCNLEVR